MKLIFLLAFAEFDRTPLRMNANASLSLLCTLSSLLALAACAAPTSDAQDETTSDDLTKAVVFEQIPIMQDAPAAGTAIIATAEAYTAAFGRAPLGIDFTTESIVTYVTAALPAGAVVVPTNVSTSAKLLHLGVTETTPGAKCVSTLPAAAQQISLRVAKGAYDGVRVATTVRRTACDWQKPWFDTNATMAASVSGQGRECVVGIGCNSHANVGLACTVDTRGYTSSPIDRAPLTVHCVIEAGEYGLTAQIDENGQFESVTSVRYESEGAADWDVAGHVDDSLRLVIDRARLSNMYSTQTTETWLVGLASASGTPCTTDANDRALPRCD